MCDDRYHKWVYSTRWSHRRKYKELTVDAQKKKWVIILLIPWNNSPESKGPPRGFSFDLAYQTKTNFQSKIQQKVNNFKRWNRISKFQISIWFKNAPIFVWKLYTIDKLILTSPETQLTVEGPERYLLTVDAGRSTKHKNYEKHDMYTSILSTSYRNCP